MARNHWDAYALVVAREMGHQWRKRYLGDPDPLGYPSRSILGKLREEGMDGASQSFARQHFPEFYTGDALLGRRVMHGLREHDRTAIMFHFYAKGVPVKLKAHELDWSVRTYWRRVNRAMAHLAGGLRAPDEKWHKLNPGGWHIDPLEFANVA